MSVFLFGDLKMKTLSIIVLALGATLLVGCQETLTPQQKEAVELREFCNKGENFDKQQCKDLRGGN